MRLAHARCATCGCARCTHSARADLCGSCFSNGRPRFRHPFTLEPSLFDDAAACPNCARNEALALSASGSSSAPAPR